MQWPGRITPVIDINHLLAKLKCLLWSRFLSTENANRDIAGWPNAARQHSSSCLILRAHMSPAHNTGFEGPGQHLNLADAAATLAATDRNPACEPDLGTTENSLVFTACERLVVPFHMNPKWHLLC